MGMLHLSGLRMSAFFFISGVLFSTRRFPDFKSYFVHKTKVLFLPYLVLSLLFLLLDPVIYNFNLFPRAPKMTIMNIHPVIQNVWDYIYWNLAKIFVAGKSSIGSGPIWFVFTLYSISLIFYLVQSILPSKKALKNIGIALVAIIGLTSGWLLYKNHIRLPLGLERDLTTLAFFALGFLSKDLIKYLQQKSPKVLLPITLAAFGLYIYFEDGNPYFSMMNNDLGKSLVTFVGSSITGILGLVSAFILFTSSKAASFAPIAVFRGILRNISRNALIILAVHWWALLALRLVFKPALDQPGIAYLSIPIVVAVVMGAIPLFRSKLYFLLGKEKISAKESLSVK